jgi:nucleobase transporter 1/2
MFIASLTIPILLAPAICMGEDNVGKSEITGTLFVASGIITLLQTGFGCR